jgi:O-antigen/teichoic acid export membrane protein
MRKKVLQVIQSKSNRNILILFSGNVLALLIQLITAPFIARIYTPKEVGSFALIFSTISIITPIINGRYELAILMPRTKVGTYSVFFLATLISMFISIILLPISIVFSRQIAQCLGDVNIAKYIFFIPLISLLIGIYNPLRYYFTRKSNYNILSVSQVSKSLAQSVLQIGLGILKFREAGIIWGFFLSQFAGNASFIKLFYKEYKIEKNYVKVKWKTIKHVLVKYKDYPLFSSWAIFASTFAMNITVFYINGLYGTNNLGYYSLMQRYIASPLAIVSTAVGQVFMQELAVKYRLSESGMSIFKSYVKKLGILGAGILIPLYFLAKPVVSMLFGSKWIISADLTQIFAPVMFIQFIAIPLQMVGVVYQKQKLFLALQIGTFFMYLLPILVAEQLKLSMNSFFRLQAVTIGTWCLITLYFYYNIIRKHNLVNMSS